MSAIVIERVIPVAPQVAFEAWLDPKALARFMTPQMGMGVGKVEVDARVGGAFLIVMTLGGRDLPHRGEYQEITRYTRLAFTWRSHVAGEGSRVTLTFTPVGEHTRLVLEHVGIDDVEPRRSHVSGWTQILDELVSLGGRASGADVDGRFQ